MCFTCSSFLARSHLIISRIFFFFTQSVCSCLKKKMSSSSFQSDGLPDWQSRNTVFNKFYIISALSNSLSASRIKKPKQILFKTYTSPFFPPCLAIRLLEKKHNSNQKQINNCRALLLELRGQSNSNVHGYSVKLRFLQWVALVQKYNSDIWHNIINLSVIKKNC